MDDFTIAANAAVPLDDLTNILSTAYTIKRVG